MSLKRLVPTVLLALVAAAAVVSLALAGGIADEPCPNIAGEHTNTCPPGTEGVPYSITFKEREGSGCGPGLQKFEYGSGTIPPGLSLGSSGTLSGTPTQAGNYSFYVVMREPTDLAGCAGEVNDKRFTIPIKPGVPVPPPLPRLIIGPESVSPGTVGTPYMAAMTANLPDAKTWAIVVGTLPTGLNLGASDGVISGMPAIPGAYSFTVQARIADGRSDTKTLTLEMRDRLTLARSGDFETRVVRTEVGVEFDGGLFATGGFGEYLWSVDGDLPPGLTLDDDGSISGSPEKSGSYRFTIAVTDAEGRRAAYAARVLVAKRLAIKTKRLSPGKVGRFLSRKVVTLGGVGPKTTRVTRGPLPRGVFF
ncbi:MAG: Ig domain-containing protein, partial [Actinomycetota bacterium]|nr:Ig domain-containing protein [Actinomycetota bacterium]